MTMQYMKRVLILNFDVIPGNNILTKAKNFGNTERSSKCGSKTLIEYVY